MVSTRYWPCLHLAAHHQARLELRRVGDGDLDEDHVAGGGQVVVAHGLAQLFSSYSSRVPLVRLVGDEPDVRRAQSRTNSLRLVVELDRR